MSILIVIVLIIMTTKIVIIIKPKLSNKRKKKNKGLVWVNMVVRATLKKVKPFSEENNNRRLNAKGNKTPITYDYPSNG